MMVLPGIVLPWTELQYPGGQSTAPMQPTTSLSRGKGEGSLLSSSKNLFFFSSARQRERKHCFTRFWCLLRYSSGWRTTCYCSAGCLIQYAIVYDSVYYVCIFMGDSIKGLTRFSSCVSLELVKSSRTPSSAISLSRGKGEGSLLSLFKKFLFS